LSHDKVTVDEPLISTDVDNLIRTIAERKKVALSDLRDICKIDKRTMDKWIAVLEDEGYVSVEYGLRGTYVHWKLDAGVKQPVAAEEEIKPEPIEEIDSADSGDVHVEFRESAPMEEPEESQKETAESESGDDSEPEELLSQYLAKKFRGEDHDNIKSKILTNLEDEKSGAGAVESREDEKTGPETTEDLSEEEAPVLRPGAPKKPMPTQKMAAADMREVISTYMQEIGREKAKIESLKKEREALYRDKVAVIEGKMQADIVVLTEKILEKQSKVAEIKESVLELPDKVDELDKLQKQMDALKSEGREALERTKKKAEQYISSVESSKEDIEEKVSDVKESLDEQSARLKSFEVLGASLDAKAGKVKDALESVKSQVEDLGNAMDALSSDLESVEEAKSEIASMTESVKGKVASHGAELVSLEEELAGVERVERWIQEYVNDYSRKIEEIERYVARSEGELEELREAAEALYMKKYIGELENMSDSYESELSDAVSKDKDIEQKISESRSRINDLAQESQQMIRKLRGEVPATDYDSLVTRVKEKTAKVSRVIDEKRQERAKLSEDSGRTRKSVKPFRKVVPRKVAQRKVRKASKVAVKRRRK